MNDDRTHQIEHRARTEKRTKDRDYMEEAEAVIKGADKCFWGR